MAKFEESKELIAKIRQKISDWQSIKMPTSLEEEHHQLIDATKDHLNDLEEQLLTVNPEDEKSLNKIYDSLLDADKQLIAAQMLTNATMLTFNTTKEEQSNPQHIQQLNMDTLRVAANLGSRLISEESKTLQEKMMAFTKACVHGTIQMCQGVLQGYDKEPGFLNTVKNMATDGLQQGIEGFNRSLDTSLLNEEEKTQQIIAELKTIHNKILEEDTNDPIKNARKEVIKEESKYLDKLIQKFNESDTKEEKNQATRSLELLQLSNAGSSLLNSGLSFVRRALGEEHQNPKALEDIGKNIVNITENVNELLNDSSQKWPSKLWTMTKAFASAAQKGVESFAHGFQGDNWKAKTVNALENAFSGFTKQFSQSLEKNKALELSADNPIFMSSPISTFSGQLEAFQKETPQDLSNTGENSDDKTDTKQQTYKK